MSRPSTPLLSLPAIRPASSSAERHREASACRAEAVGSLAGELLATSGNFRVLGGGSHAIYLRHHDGQIVWLGTLDTALHRRAIVVDRLPRVPAGCVLAADRGRLRHGSRLVLDAGMVQVWAAATNLPKRTLEAAELQRRLHHLTAIAADGATPLLAAIIRLLASVPACGADEVDPFVRTALGRLHAALLAIAAGDRTSAALEVLSLVGLGPGFTPSGDDIAGGFLFATAALRTYGHFLRAAAADLQRGVAACATQTHPVSFALLRDYLIGHGPEPLHALAHELLSADSGGTDESTVRRLRGIGHHSGSDLLAGFLLGLRMAKPAGSSGRLFLEE